MTGFPDRLCGSRSHRAARCVVGTGGRARPEARLASIRPEGADTGVPLSLSHDAGREDFHMIGGEFPWAALRRAAVEIARVAPRLGSSAG